MGRRSVGARGIGDATNQYAAMPSMHFGWSLWCAIQIWGFKSGSGAPIAVAYPTIARARRPRHRQPLPARRRRRRQPAWCSRYGIVYGIRAIVERVRRHDLADAADAAEAAA